MSQAGPDAELCVDFRLTLPEYRAAILHLSMALWPFKAFVALTIVSAIAGLVIFLNGADALGIALLVIAIAWGLVIALVLLVRPRRLYRRQERLRAQQTYCFTGSEVSWSFIDGDSRVRWTYFEDVRQAGDIYLLRHQMRRLGSVIPRRAFKTPAEEARFRQLAQLHSKTNFGATSPESATS
ncbi:MAG: YcxB family protein [Candidatus Dormibacteraeota bacterium]|nr:YcxB family protein [Candidatus Dormibacteraeota bacterium]